MSARRAHDRENALMEFVWRIFHRSQRGSIIMDTRIHNDAPSKLRQSTPTSSSQEHTNLYPVPPAEGENWSMRPVSTSMEAISVLKCLANIPSSMAPPHVAGFRMVVMYLSRGALCLLSEIHVAVERVCHTPELLRCRSPDRPGYHRRRLPRRPSCANRLRESRI